MFVSWGAWVVQSVKPLTLDFGSSYDLTAYRFKPHVSLCADSVEPVWDSLSPSLSACPLLTLAVSLKMNKIKPKSKEF